MTKYIRFDWAMKRLLRQKANFAVLEGFLTSLLGETVKICSILESESNQESRDDKFNRVDLLAENNAGELFIVEVQHNRELDYFHRMLYGVSKAIAEHIHLGEDYNRVRKVYSINIVYFDLGQGKDYVYHGYTEFRGIHDRNDVLGLSDRQKTQFNCNSIGDLYPEFYILRVEGFDGEAVTPLDEWIRFLKTDEIPDTARAPGLAEARRQLTEDKMSKAERQQYRAHIESLRYQRSVIKTSLIEGEAIGLEKGEAIGLEKGEAIGLEKGEAIGIEKGEVIGMEKNLIETVLRGYRNGFTIEQIMVFSGLSREKVLEIIELYGAK